MNPADKTTPTQTESIAFEFDLPHPAEKVWRALTEPALLAEWLLPVAGFKLDAGASFAFHAQPQPGWDGVVNCKLREIEPHRKLSYAWVVGDIHTVVTFTLTPAAGSEGKPRTLLSVVQSGFKPSQKQAFGGARYGWRMMGGKLVDLLAKTE
ncbi:MAG: SRPBCC domain-containing protein [Phycisphaerae bacterium]